MKKIISFPLLILMFAAPSLSFAETTEDVQTIIARLTKQIEQLQAQILVLQKQSAAVPAWCHDFKTNLGIGTTGDEMGALENALAKEGFSVEHSSNFAPIFDEQLAATVTGFQEKYRDEILTPAGLSFGTGYVGPRTREALNKRYGCVQTLLRPISQPTITTKPLYFGLPQATTLKQSYLQVLSPNGGENLTVGKTYTIRWSGGLEGDTAKIMLYALNTFPEWKYTIAEVKNTGSTQSYVWAVPSLDVLGLSAVGVSYYGSPIFTIDINSATGYYGDSSDAPLSIIKSSVTQ